MKQKKSIEGNIRKSLLGYSIFIVLLLWIFQVLFLNTYYQTMQKASIMRAGTQIVRSVGQENFEQKLEEISFSHRMCSLIINTEGQSLYSVDMMGKGCLIHSPARFSLMKMILPVVTGEKDEMVERVNLFLPLSKVEDEMVERVKDSHFRTAGLIYVRAVTGENGERMIIVLNAALDPVKSTAGILKSQLWIISAVLLIISMIISRIVARNISKPLQQINEKARRMAAGEYTADYTGGGIADLEELADTLNFAAQGLSEVEELRRELVANVSHDLKTPLTMIKAYAEMIRDLTGDHPQKRGEQLDVIISETDRLTALVSMLIRISQDESKDKLYQPETFSLDEMIVAIVSRFDEVNPEYKVNFICDTPARVYADQESIGQVLYNLLSNAINYTGEDRIVSLSMHACPFGVRIEIRDSGKGIPADQLPLIWERYYRSHNTHQREVVGSGLGLSIVRGALVAQNLPFGVESEVGKGSCFWFELPFDNTSKPLEEPKKAKKEDR